MQNYRDVALVQQVSNWKKRFCKQQININILIIKFSALVSQYIWLTARFYLGHYCFPAGIYLLKVNNRNTRCEICSKLTIKIPKRHQWRRSGIFIVNFEHIPHLVLSIVNFEYVIAGWVWALYLVDFPMLLSLSIFSDTG